MATQNRFIQEDHFVDVTKDVFLTITIGNDQIGGSRVKWKEQIKLLGIGKIISLNLGKGSDLVGRKLSIVTNFFDRNPNTNNVSSMYNFNNGTDPIHIFFDKVKKDNDKFVFNIEFTFKTPQP